ncbi:arylsulfatase [uncultured Draconibacterium sp.]|uniref:sulfatase family protein n=1 Tax=uncultured Draconibacterium sp. TaxID=1573823 RepID=UPI0029C7BB8C|nr:arylsulfatase [uncultured Draconibacterium sp.]
MKNLFLKSTIAILFAISVFSINAQNKKPNIVFILADDFGYSSVNCYGADKNLLRTPHIDGLAEAGMRFTHAHTPASICSPTRYGFLTGRYPWRSSMKFGVVAPNGALLPNPDRTTIADILKEQGYNTAAIGKWHLGYGDKQPCDFTGKLTPGPLDLGFDYHFAVPQNHGDYWGVYVENDEIYGLRSKKQEPYSRTFYGKPYLGFDAPQRVNRDVMGDLTDKSVEWLKQQSADTPFFLYFAQVAVHRPITPSAYMRGVSNCGPYGDFIQDVDMSVGRIVETLKYLGLYENTIIIFSSDNGGVIPENKPDDEESQAIKLGLKINGDLKGRKHTIWEGGTNVPFIVSWPGKVEQGTVSNSLVNLTDIFSTVADITGEGLPGNKDVAPDSFSFLPALLNKKNNNPRISMVTADAKGMHALRMGDWKYIDPTAPEGYPKNKMNQFKNEKQQLYNLADDPAETTNVIEKYPEKVKQLQNELNRIRSESSSR